MISTRWLTLFSLTFILIGVDADLPPAQAQTASPTGSSSSQQPALVSLHVDQNEPAVMSLALNNAQNIRTHYKALGRPAIIEIVTYGPGLNMLRTDKSPVKARIEAMALEDPDLTFAACGNTRESMANAEGAPVLLIGEAKLVPSGVVRLIELQTLGYAYIKP